MKSIFAAVALATLTVPLAACGGNGDDALAERAEDAAENKADQLEAAGNEAGADMVEEAGEERADAIDDADVNAHAMTNAQKADVIENGVAPTN